MQQTALGATMHLTFAATLTNTSNHSRKDAEVGLQIGWEAILGINIGTNLSNAQKSAISNYRLELKCYTQGASVDVCGKYSLNTSFDIEKDRVALAERIETAKQQLVAEAKAGEHLVVVQEKHLDYEVPEEMCELDGEDPCPKKFDVFFDHNPRVNVIKSIVEKTTAVERTCSDLSFWPNRCRVAKESLDQSIRSCMDTTEACAITDSENINVIASAAAPGYISIWTKSDRRGDHFFFDIGNMMSQGQIAPWAFKNFPKYGLARCR